MASTTAVPVYDSDQRRLPLAELRHFWEYRGLILLLTGRNVTSRYKRSFLGVWWTLLNPMLTVAVYWLVFSGLFQRVGQEVPFIVYVTSGVLVVHFFGQGIAAAGAALAANRGILAKVYTPPEVFPLATAIAAAVNFVVGLVPLVILQLTTGVGIPWQFSLIPVSVVFMLMMITGLGLVVASAAVRFSDVLDLVRVVTLLLTYLSAVFYPISIIPEHLRWFLYLNPLYHHLDLFRAFAYGEGFTWISLGVVVGSGILSLAIGIWTFSRNWRSVVVSL